AGLRQYAIEHGMDPEKFSVITETEKNRWAMGCFREDLEKDIRFCRGGIKRNEDTRKYHKFLTDRDRLVGEELLRHGILKKLMILWKNGKKLIINSQRYLTKSKVTYNA
ncbi:8071_t:CDS:1, partial [Ambispora leptoticha]